MPTRFKNIFPNLLTLSRGFFVILISLVYFSNLSFKYILIYVFFLLASISDYYDGKLARKWGVKSNFGVVFDSLFDKIFTFIMYILLIPHNLIHTGVFIALIFRDLLIDGVKNFSLSKGVPVSPKMTGKLKMVFQTLLINFGLLTLSYPNTLIFKNLLYLSAFLALTFSYYSGFGYMSDFLSNSRKSNK